MKLKDKQAFPTPGSSNGHEPTMRGFRTYIPVAGMTLKEYAFIQLMTGLVTKDLVDPVQVARNYVDQMFTDS